MTDASKEREGGGTAAGAPSTRPMAWWERLRKHKVAQWTLAYGAGAYTLLHVVEMVSGALEWPHVVVRVATLLLLLGLPVATTLAWFHGHKGQQRMSGPELAVLTVLLVIAAGVLWLVGRPAHERAAEKPASPATTAAADVRPAIAVLPFKNRSDQSKDAFFVDGIHDDILTQLTRIGAMKVIARTSVEQFRDTRLTTREIGEKLGVTRILEGGVQRAGDRVRITVQLIDATTDGHLWAETYDRELTAANIFAIQSEVAMAIAVAMKARLTSAEKSRISAIPTRNLEAWESYQLGQQRMATRNTTGLAEAEKFFRKALELDPGFALAYVGLSSTLALQVYMGASREPGIPDAQKAVATALELDPTLAEAWAASGLVADFRLQDARAEPMFRRAIELNPNYATAYVWLGILMINLGREEEALGCMERAVELDPWSPIANTNLGGRLDALGRFEEAEARYRKVIEIDPKTAVAYQSIALVQAHARNHFADAAWFAEKSVEVDPGRPGLRLLVAELYFNLGDDAQASRVIEATRAGWPDHDSWREMTVISAMYRGDAEAARQNAETVLALWPHDARSLALLRNLDIQAGHYAEARRRYATAYPALLAEGSPEIGRANLAVALDLALVRQKTGESEPARALLDAAEARIRTMPRLGGGGYGIADAQVFALRGQKSKALAALRQAEKAGWRWGWRYHRDFDPSLASIRSEREFKAIFADIERDMARQRAEVAARRKDAPLDLATVH